MLLAEVPAEAVALVSEYLAALYGPQPDPAAHLACCSPQALVLVGDRVERREDVDEAGYAAAISALLREAAGRPRPVLELVRIEEASADDEVAALRGRVREVAGGREFGAVFVLDDYGVLGAYVEEGVGVPLDPHFALAHSAAEFCQPPSGTGADACLGGLDLSYDRVFGGTLSSLGQLGPGRELVASNGLFPPGAGDVALRWLPEARFSCAWCGESCRASKWRNTASDAARQALEAMPWGRLAPGLLALPLFKAPADVDPDSWRGDVELAVRDDGFCAFHDTARGCLIHALLGRQPLPSCNLFPFGFTRTPDGVDVWATFHCHAALHGSGLPFEAREADIRQRLWSARTPQRFVGPAVILAGRQEVAWAAYREIERELLAWLAPDAPGSLASRLFAAEGFLQALIERRACEAVEVAPLAASWRERPLLDRPREGIPDPLVQGLVVGMFRRYPPDDGPRPFPLDGLAFLLGGMPPPDRDIPEPVLSRYLRHVLFHKHFLQTEGALFTWRMVLLSYSVVRRYAWSLAWLEREGFLSVSAGLDPDLRHVQKAIQDLDRLVIHAGTYFARFLKNYPEDLARLLAAGSAPTLIWS